MEAKYKRVVIKLSGEALAGEKGFGIDPPTVNGFALPSKRFLSGCGNAIVVGGGNFWRGRLGEGMDKASAEYMGMLCTVINALALQDFLEQMGVPVRVQTAIEMKEVAEPYIKRKAMRHLEKRRVVIFAAGTGNPFFTTALQRPAGAEIDADIILLGKE